MSYFPRQLTQHVKSIKTQHPGYNSDQIYAELMKNYGAYYIGKNKLALDSEIIDTLRFLIMNPTWQLSTVQPIVSVPSTSGSTVTEQQLHDVIYIKKQLETEGNKSPSAADIYRRYQEKYPNDMAIDLGEVHYVSLQLPGVERALQHLRNNPSLDKLSDEELNQLKRAQKERWEVKQAIYVLKQQLYRQPTTDEIVQYLKGTSIWRGQADPTITFTVNRDIKFLQQHPNFIYMDESSRVEPTTAPEIVSELNNFRWNVLQIVKSMRKDGAAITPSNIEKFLVNYFKVNMSQPYRSHDLQRKIQEALEYLHDHPNFSYSHHRPTFDPLAVIGYTKTIHSNGTNLSELGIDKSLPEIMKFIAGPTYFASQYQDLKTKPSKIALLIMPEGFDVDLIISSIVFDRKMKLYAVDMTKFLDERINSETILQNTFTEASEGAPSVIHIAHLDRFFHYLNNGGARISIAKRTLEMQRFLSKVQEDARQVLIIATINSTALMSELLSAEYFSTQIMIPLPDNESRKAMFIGMVYQRNVSEEVLEAQNLQEIISHTPGYTHADLKLLFDVASNFTIERVRSSDEILQISMADIRRAIHQIKPLSVQSGASTIPNVSWNDLGGLFDVKQEIFSSIMYPLKYPEIYKKFGITQSSGIMLYGPPGTGKTMIAKAVANDATANFIAVKPSDILGKYLGQSEGNVQSFFAKAAALAPCILFFDEFESIGGTRSSGGDGFSQARNSVVTQLLTEMDGVQSRNGVYLLAATNRLDAVDPAFLRPGRFDKQIFVGLPSLEERANILDVAIQGLKVNGIEVEDVNTKNIARQTDGFSAADLTALVRETASLAAREFIQSASEQFETAVPKITSDQFDWAIRNNRKIVLIPTSSSDL